MKAIMFHAHLCKLECAVRIYRPPKYSQPPEELREIIYDTGFWILRFEN